MNKEETTLTLDASEEGEKYISVGSAALYRQAFPTNIPFSSPYGAAVGATEYGTIDIGGAIYVYTAPTAQWYTIYPQVSTEIDILEDFDIKFEPKKTKKIKGIVVKRERGKLITAFADEIIDEEEVD